jgi:acetyl esterase
VTGPPALCGALVTLEYVGDDRALSLRDRVQYHAARTAGRLPARLLHVLAGGSPLRVDGSVLDDQLHLGLRFWNRKPDRRPEDVATRRRETRRSSAIMAGPPVPVRDVRALSVDGAQSALAARLYVPFGHGTDTPQPLLVWFHGGGFVLGDLDSADQPVRMLCRHGDLNVLSVDYRLAPEHPFPAAVDDAVAAFDWTVAHVDELGADPTRIAVGGDSAGANLAAVVAAQRRGPAGPAAQLLLYPAVDMVTAYPSLDRFADGYFLTSKDTDWFIDHYAAGADRSDPRMSPLLADDHSGLAPAMVATAAFDVLRDGGEAYAYAMRRAGVPVVLRRVPRLIHGFANTVGINRAAYEATVGVATAFRTLLELSDPLSR